MSEKEKIQIEVEVPSQALHVEHASCPAGHSLRDETVQIHGHPALKVNIKCKGKSGVLYLDPIYGSFDNIEKGIKLAKGDLVEMFCPSCGVNLKDAVDTCQLCSAPMFVFHLPKGGIIEGCTRRGCMFHKLKIVDGAEQVSRLFQNSTLESYL
jgi:hypothetical protein